MHSAHDPSIIEHGRRSKRRSKTLRIRDEETFKLKQTTASERYTARVCLWVMAQAREATSVATAVSWPRSPRAASRTMSWQKSNETPAVQPFRGLKQYYLFPRKCRKRSLRGWLFFPAATQNLSFFPHPLPLCVFFSSLSLPLFLVVFLLLFSLRFSPLFWIYPPLWRRGASKGRGELWNLRLKKESNSLLGGSVAFARIKGLHERMSRIQVMTEYWLPFFSCEQQFCLCKQQ